jgi:hypothetical protein
LETGPEVPTGGDGDRADCKLGDLLLCCFCCVGRTVDVVDDYRGVSMREGRAPWAGSSVS